MNNMNVTVVITLSFHYLTPTPSFGLVLHENLVTAGSWASHKLWEFHPPVLLTLVSSASSHAIGGRGVVLVDTERLEYLASRIEFRKHGEDLGDHVPAFHGAECHQVGVGHRLAFAQTP